MKDFTVSELSSMSEDLLDLTKIGWERSIYFDSSKLAEECGEVAAALNKSHMTDEDLAAELSDVIAVCFVIAAKKNIDLNSAIEKKQKERIKKLIFKYHEGKQPEDFSLRVNV